MKPFSVPQFIDIEDKIIGPLTLKQFLWCLAGIIILAVFYKTMPLPLVIIAGAPVAGLFASLAFLKINGRPLIYFFLSGANFFIKPKLFLFKKAEKRKKPIFTKNAKKQKTKIKPKPNLQDMAWQLDVQNKHN